MIFDNGMLIMINSNEIIVKMSEKNYIFIHNYIILFIYNIHNIFIMPNLKYNIYIYNKKFINYYFINNFMPIKNYKLIVEQELNRIKGKPKDSKLYCHKHLKHARRL